MFGVLHIHHRVPHRLHSTRKTLRDSRECDKCDSINDRFRGGPCTTEPHLTPEHINNIISNTMPTWHSPVCDPLEVVFDIVSCVENSEQSTESKTSQHKI